MPIISVNGKEMNVNPSVVELGTYQKHGLAPTDRKPNDFLRMVARTFSTFRNTPAQDTVVSYINGFNVSVNEEHIIEKVDWLDTEHTYNVFRISSGACMIDNQLIDIYQDSVFFFKDTEFIQNTKYAIVVEYDYIEQRQDNVARIRFINYDALNFPREDDLNVVDCDFEDTSLNGNSTAVEFSGKPGLLVATFATGGNIGGGSAEGLQIIQSNPAVPGAVVPGIDPQYLSKLYIQNYKLLFEYFGNQARPIFSSMGLTNANFLSVSRTQISSDLLSGDMCYLNSETNLYEKSIASQQKFSKVIGLYLNEVNEGNHLIYTTGTVTLNAVKHNLPLDHQLLNMNIGSNYFLEDSSSLFDTNNEIRTIDNYVLADSSGRVSSRYYPSAVIVGTATACNQLNINIDRGAEIGTGNLISIFGKFSEYEKEFNANDIVISNEDKIVNNNLIIYDMQDLKTDTESKLGNEDAAGINAIKEFALTYASPTFTLLLADVLPRYFEKGSNINSISSTVLDLTDDLDTYNGSDKIVIIDTLNTYNSLYNIKYLLIENLKDLKALLEENELILNDWIINLYHRSANKLKILQIDLKISRYLLGDDFDVMNDFENEVIANSVSPSYASQISDLQVLKTSIILEDEDEEIVYHNQVREINSLEKSIANIEMYIENLNLTISYNVSTNLINTTNIANLEISNAALTVDRDNAAGNIMNGDSLKLDIFLMDDHQRIVFNYTYITDRLRKRILLVDHLAKELIKAKTVFTAVQNNELATIIEKITSIEEVNRLENAIQNNNNLITNYTEEYNRIRVSHFSLTPISEGSDFDDGGYSNQQIGSYRYGCDDYETTYGGLATNLISSPCGPYTSPDSLIIAKNSGIIIVDVLANDGHSQGDTLTVNLLDAPEHGDSILTHSIVHTGLNGTDFINYTIENADGTPILFDSIITNSNITFVLTNLDNIEADILDYIVKDDGVVVDANSIVNQSVVAYKPLENYTGTDLMSYGIVDSDNKVATGTVQIFVTGPYIIPDTINVYMNTNNVSLETLSNDGHTNGENIALLSTTQPDHGTVTIMLGDVNTGDRGSMNYTPDTDYEGNDYFTYTIIDESGSEVSGQVHLIVGLI